MSWQETKMGRIAAGLKKAVSNWWATEVPEEVALCEFDCRRPDCTAEDWRTCDRRLEDCSRSEAKEPQVQQLAGLSQAASATAESAAPSKTSTASAPSTPGDSVAGS